MPEDTMNDWPDEITVDVVSPLAYLRTQAGLLSGKTKGLLQGDVTTMIEKGVAYHRLELVGAGLRNARKVVLTASHKENEPYPVDIEADCIQPHDSDVEDYRELILRRATREEYFIRVNSLRDLRGVVRAILRSEPVTVALNSMIALINEKKATAAAS